MPKIVDYAERRREIAEKAIPVFAQGGFRDANLSQIAELCGFGRTTIYKYFKDKDEIFQFALAGIFDQLEERALAIEKDASLDSVARLERMIESMVRGSLDNRDRMLIILDPILRQNRDAASMPSATGERLGRLKSHYQRILAEGMASGEIRPGDPTALASVLFSIVESFVLQFSIFGSLSFEKAMEATSLLLDGLRA